jgi:glutathione S-transferase
MTRLYELAGAEAERRFSPYCWRIRMALAHKGIAPETVAWRFTDKAAIAPSGQGRVPVLVEGERWISDSQPIAEYLEDVYSDRLSLFGGAGGRALSRFTTAWTDTAVHGALIRMLVLDVWRHLDAKDREYFRTSREARFGAALETVVADREARLPAFRASLEPARQVLARQDYLGGEQPLYPDYTLFGAFQWARCISDFSLLAADDPVAAWRGRMLGLFGGLAGAAVGYPV